jgi:hypothetical protein
LVQQGEGLEQMLEGIFVRPKDGEVVDHQSEAYCSRFVPEEGWRVRQLLVPMAKPLPQPC